MERETTVTLSELLENAGREEQEVINIVVERLLERRLEARKLTAKAQRTRTKELIALGREAKAEAERMAEKTNS